MIEQNVIFLVMALFMALTWRDLFATNPSGKPDKAGVVSSARDVHQHHHHMDHMVSDYEDQTTKTVLEPEYSPKSLDNNIETAPTIMILYCHSCGYKHAFEETSKLLRQNFPHFRIVGGLHQPSWLRGQLVQFLFLFKMVTMGLILMNINPFNYLGVATPQAWTYIMEHKMYALMLIFFLTQTIEANLMSTGAFEIFYNDIPIWSKIESGRMPSPYELLQSIGSQGNFKARSKMVADFTPTT